MNRPQTLIYHLLLRTFAAMVLLPVGLSAAANYTVLGWTEFGVNPMERGYSVFAIYPPFVTIHAQVVDGSGVLVKSGSGIQVTYEALADPNASTNSTSTGKTDFWTYAKSLFGLTTGPDTGIYGAPMPGATRQPMQFEASLNRFTAKGVPFTPYDDQRNINYYPLLKISALDAAGNVLGSARLAILVSNEVECRSCHASGANSAARPATGYVNDPDPNRDFKLNILALHDSKNARNPVYSPMLATVGYSTGGLLPTASGGTPVRCEVCHASNRLGTPGQAGVEALTTAMHGHHAGLIDPKTNDTLDNATDRAACYNCHPGAATHGLRGAMGHSVAADGSVQIQCQSCHGNLSALADPNRQGYVNLPNCQACHTTTAPYRQTNAFVSGGKLRTTSDATFATTGNGLFSASVGHGGLQCSACHGSTHGEFPSGAGNENLRSQDAQGNSGVIADCTVCHKSGVTSSNGGPHGLHTVGINWVSLHPDYAGRGAATCATCHGPGFQGSVLSRASVNRSLNTSFGTITMFPGYQVSCYTCHLGSGGNGRSGPGLTLSNTSASITGGQSVTIPVSGVTSSTLRILQQTLNGTAHVSGSSIIYQANPDFEGTDQVTYAAVNSAYKDSNLAVATIKVTAPSRPVFPAAGVVSAASYTGPLAPGMIAILQGKGLGPANLQSYELNSGGFFEKAIGSLKVFFDGVAAPLLYGLDGQTAAIVPYSAAGKSSTNITVQYNGATSAVVAVPVAATSPGVFSANASGQGQAAALNQDGTLNSAANPAAAGSVVTLYLTGDGLETPQTADGQLNIGTYPATAAPVTVTVAGNPAAVAYAGAAPTAVAGLMQVNFTVPANTPSGTAAVVVSCGGTQSQSGIMIQVR